MQLGIVLTSLQENIHVASLLGFTSPLDGDLSTPSEGEGATLSLGGASATQDTHLAEVLMKTLLRNLGYHTVSSKSKSGSYSAVLWQKEATLENDFSRKWARRVCHVHWHQCNIMMSWLNRYLSAGCVFLLQTRNGSRIRSNLKISLSQIWVICNLLPFGRVLQYCRVGGNFVQ